MRSSASIRHLQRAQDKLEASWGKLFGYATASSSLLPLRTRRAAGQDVVLDSNHRPARRCSPPACGLAASIATATHCSRSPPSTTTRPPKSPRRTRPLHHSDQGGERRRLAESGPANLPAQYAILDDRERPYYEHRWPRRQIHPATRRRFHPALLIRRMPTSRASRSRCRAAHSSMPAFPLS